jgi:hypothetical protein
MGQSGVTLTTALTNVRSMLDEPNPQFWTNSELTLWLNEACTDIARRSETLRQTATIAVTAGTQSFPAPVDTYRIYRIEFATSGVQTYTLEYRGMEGMDQYWGNLQTQPAAWPALYTLWYSPVSVAEAGSPAPTQMMIKTYPVASQNGSLIVYYYRLIVPVTSGAPTATLDCLPGWEDVAYDYAVYKALRKDADPRWKEQHDLYESRLLDMIDRSRSWTDQPDYFSTGPTGQPAWLLGGD